MMKKCTCKNGKTDPKCPACSKKDVNLDSFHKLNPEARPKTAELFKIAATPGLWGGLAQASKDSILNTGKAGLQSALVPAGVAALTAGLSADPGQGWGDAAKAGLVAGGVGALAGAGHYKGMTGKSEAAHAYQRGVGGDIRNIGNWGREQMGSPLLAHPDTPRAPAKKVPAAVPVPSVVPPAEPVVKLSWASKTSMFYEFGKTDALTNFNI